MFNYLDRNNIAQARLNSFEEDLGLVGNQFNVAVSILNVGYMLAQLPSNMIVSLLSRPIWLFWRHEGVSDPPEAVHEYISDVLASPRLPHSFNRVSPSYKLTLIPRSQKSVLRYTYHVARLSGLVSQRQQLAPATSRVSSPFGFSWV